MRSIIRRPLLLSFLLAFPVQAEVVTPEQFWQIHQKIPQGKQLIIDVRSNDEFLAGHLPNAINIPHNDISRLPTIAKDKTQPIFIYCRSGRRSGVAESAIDQLGYQYIYNGENYQALLEAMPAELEK